MITSEPLTWENLSSNMHNQRRLISASASPQSDQRLYCSHEETLHPWISKCDQWRFWSDWANAQADLNLRQATCPYVFWRSCSSVNTTSGCGKILASLVYHSQRQWNRNGIHVLLIPQTTFFFFKFSSVHLYTFVRESRFRTFCSRTLTHHKWTWRNWAMNELRNLVVYHFRLLGYRLPLISYLILFIPCHMLVAGFYGVTLAIRVSVCPSARLSYVRPSVVSFPDDNE